MKNFFVLVSIIAFSRAIPFPDVNEVVFADDEGTDSDILLDAEASGREKRDVAKDAIDKVKNATEQVKTAKNEAGKKIKELKKKLKDIKKKLSPDQLKELKELAKNQKPEEVKEKLAQMANKLEGKVSVDELTVVVEKMKEKVKGKASKA